MITPKDIEVKEFSKSVRGYNVEQVDEFLDLIIIDYQKALAEIESLKLEVENLNEDIEKQKQAENSVVETLESAKVLMQDISESAERRAEIIVKNAKLDAKAITKDARDTVIKLSRDTEILQKEAVEFREKYRNMLEEELEHLEKTEEELFRGFDDDRNRELSDDLLAVLNAHEKKEEKEPSSTNSLNIEDIFGEEEMNDKTSRESAVRTITPQDGEILDKLRDFKSENKQEENSKTLTAGSVKVTPRKTVALDSEDIEEMLKKENIAVPEE